MLKQAVRQFRQAFAFCPYSPEAVFRYAQLLLQLNRLDDALLVAQTCLKLDPYNGQVMGLVNNIQGYRKQSPGIEQAKSTPLHMEEEVHKNPANFQAAFDLAGAYLQMAQTDRAVQVLDGVLNAPQADASSYRGLIQAYSSFGNQAGLQKTVAKLETLARANPGNYQVAIGLSEGYRQMQQPDAAVAALDRALNDPKLDANGVLNLAQAYATAGNATKLEAALEKLTKVMPENPESWYDLAVLKASLGKTAEALPSLRQALDLSTKRLQHDPKARDLLANAKKEERFASLRKQPEFQKLVSP